MGKMKCSVKNCNNLQTKGSNKSFFRFPNSNPILLKAWIEFCEQTETFNPTTSRICSDHFKEADLHGKLKKEMGIAGRPTIKKGAIPSRKTEVIVDEEMIEHVQQTENERVVDSVLKPATRNPSLTIREKIVTQISKPMTMICPIVLKARTPSPSWERRGAEIYSKHMVSKGVLQAPSKTSTYTPDQRSAEFYERMMVSDDVVDVGDSQFEDAPSTSPISFEQKEVEICEEMIISENENNNGSLAVNTEIQALKKEVERLKGIIRTLKYEFSHTEQKYKAQIGKLKSQIMEQQFQSSNVDDKLQGIFTENQIRKLKKNENDENWTQDDLAASATLYSFTAKGYKLLTKLNFPLPSVRKLKDWSLKLKCIPGLLDPVFTFLAQTKHLTPKQKVCVLSFDEMKLRSSGSSSSDYVQVAMLRGLISKWEQPVFYDFDCVMSVDIIRSILKATMECGYSVVAMVCDLEGRNSRLLRELKVNHENPWFAFEKEAVYVFADVPQLIKSLRKHFINKDFINTGKPMQNVIVASHPETTTGDLSISHKIGTQYLEQLNAPEQHVGSGVEKENMKLATKLFSDTVSQAVASAVNAGRLSGENLQRCCKLLKTTNDWFDLMNVSVPKSRSGGGKYAYGLALDMQNETLSEMYKLITEMSLRANTPLPFQKGILQTNLALKLLYLDVQKRFQIESLLTSHLNQDALKSCFGYMRSQGGLVDYPDREQFKDRLKDFLIGHNRAVFSTGTYVQNLNLPMTGKILSTVWKKNNSSKFK